MSFNFKKIFGHIDFVVFFLALILSFFGLIFLYNFDGSNVVFHKQLTALVVSIFIFFGASSLDVYFFRNSKFIYLIYLISIGLLVAVLFFGSVRGGARSWFDLGFFAFQPTDFAKFALSLVLAKYFFKRHIEIARFKHLFISSIYTGLIFFLLMLQPDLGSAMIVFFIWLGFVLIAGIPKKYIISLLVLGSIVSVIGYFFVLDNYQKKRIDTFLDPTVDKLGAGYNINQANITLGSGGWIGKGISNGTQTRLHFLPESKTDFIFSAYAEETGFLGIIVLFLIYIILIFRLVNHASKGRTNFESLLASGIIIYFFAHFFVHIGINLGFLPVTGTTMPFMSKGGSHLIVEFFALGVFNAIIKTNRDFAKEDLEDTRILG